MTINRQILRLAVPSIISNVTVPLLGLVDLAIVGHMGGTSYIGAIAVGSMIFNVIYWIFGFLRMGTSGMTAQAFGSRQLDEVIRVLLRSLTIALSVSLVFLILQRPVRWLALWVIHPSADVIPLAREYFDICIWGMPAMMCLYGLTGWFIGMQNTRVPMMVAIIQNIFNIFCSLTLVYLLGMKIEGVALGTLISQWLGLLLALCFWRKDYARLLRYDYKTSLFSRKKMMRFIAVNRDIFIRTLFLVAVNLFFTSAGARQGNLILSVNALLMTLFTITSFVMDGFAYAGEALSGKYYGAGNSAAFYSMKRALFRLGAIISLLFTLLFLIGGHPFLSLLTNDASVVDAAMTYLPWALLIPFAGLGAFILDGIFIGTTLTKGMLLSSCLSALLFFAVYLTLFGSIGNHALWLALILYLLARGLIQEIYLRKKLVF